jgi:hypothetical protein
MTKAPKAAVEVPRILRDIEQATRRDIAPAVKLMSRIFVGTLLGGDESFVREVAHVASAAASSAAGRAASRAAPPSPKASPFRKEPEAAAIVVDAEIVSEECGTCGGTHKVGRKGYEVACPRCRSGR